jgi:hypothetical protein
MDPKKRHLLENAEFDFWHNHVLAKVPPELTARDHRDMSANQEWELHGEELNHYKKIVEEGEKLVEFHRKKLIELAGGKNAKGKGVKLTASECEGRIDYEALLLDYQNRIAETFRGFFFPEVDKEKFRKPSTLKFRLSTY